MTRTVNPDAYGTARPKVEPDDLEDDVAILTVVEFEEVEVDDANTESGKRMSGFLTFQETGEKVVWLNKTAILAMCEFYGTDPDKWEGVECPVEKVKGKAFGKDYHKVNVVPADAWGEIEGWSPPSTTTPRRRKSATRGTRKSTKKKSTKRVRK